MSSTIETVRQVEDTKLEDLKDMDIEKVYAHMDVLLEERPGPLDLYLRWEKQNWSAGSLDFTIDKQQWETVFTPFMQEQLKYAFAGFFVGEQAVTDTLSPLVGAAPDEESRWFLSTQLVDEARHAFFFARFFRDALGFEGTNGEILAQAREWTDTAPYNDIFGLEGHLIKLTQDVAIDPGDYGKWVKGITLYHIMVESMLALIGQKLLLRILRQLDLLPAFRAGFTAVTRDESRHVNYGVWALQQAFQKGRGEDIREVVDLTLRPCFRIYANPDRKIVIPKELPPESRIDPRTNWQFGIDSLTKRLRVIGFDSEYLKDLADRSWSYVWEAVGQYESNHGEEHPVRAWERGELEMVGS